MKYLKGGGTKMIEIVSDIVRSFMGKLANYLPLFFGGLLIFVSGVIVGGVLKKIILTLLSFFKLDLFLQKMGLMNKQEVKMWEEVFSEIVRWSVIILFLIPTLEVWQLTRATGVINQLLLYIPNVIVAVIIGFVGIIASNLVSDLVRHSIQTLGATSGNTLGLFAKGIISFFTVLIVMNQLGVAQDLVRILFTGIIAMLALAGGLAFGLGGQDSAKEILNEIKRKMK